MPASTFPHQPASGNDLARIQLRSSSHAQRLATDLARSASIFHLCASNLEGCIVNHTHLLQGFDLAPGGTARRKQTLLPLSNPRTWNERFGPDAPSSLMVEAPPSQFNDPNKMLSQVGPILANMPEKQAVPAAFAIARAIRQERPVVAGARGLHPAGQSLSDHPLAAESCRWLLRHDASSEARRRYETQSVLGADAVKAGRRRWLRPTGNSSHRSHERRSNS